MIEKIKEWVYFKYGITISKKHLWMLLILFASLVLLAGVLIGNADIGGGNEKFVPGSNL